MTGTGDVPVLPDIAIHDDGHVTTMEIAKPCWMYAWRTTELDTGMSWLSVYRSVLVRDADPMNQPVMEIIGDAELLHREVVDDQHMMFGSAEVSLYGVAA